MNKFTKTYIFKLTYNLCEFKNDIIKSLTMLFSLCKICPYFENLQVYFPQYD